MEACMLSLVRGGGCLSTQSTPPGSAPANDEVRDLLALSARLGGIALTNPTSVADEEFSVSTKVSDHLKYAILQQSFEYSSNVVYEQVEPKVKFADRSMNDPHKQQRP